MENGQLFSKDYGKNAKNAFSVTPTGYISCLYAINVGGCLPGAWSPCVFKQKHSDAPNYFLLHFLYILPSNILKRVELFLATFFIYLTFKCLKTMSYILQYI